MRAADRAMALDLISEVLTQFDVLGADGALAFSPQRNVLVDVQKRCLVDDYVSLQCQLWQPEGKGHEKFLQQALIVPGDCRLAMQQIVLWDVSKPMPPLNTKVWMLNLTDPIVVPGIHDVVLSFRDDSMWFPTPNVHSEEQGVEPLRILELFCGGFGGWKTACDFIQGHSEVEFQVIGVDHDFDACAQYAVSFHANLRSLRKSLPPSLLVGNQDNWVFHGSIDDETLIPVIGHCSHMWSRCLRLALRGHQHLMHMVSCEMKVCSWSKPFCLAGGIARLQSFLNRWPDLLSMNRSPWFCNVCIR